MFPKTDCLPTPDNSGCESDVLIDLTDLRTGERKTSFRGSDKTALSFAFTPDGQFLVAHLYDGLEHRVAAWRVSDGVRTSWFGFGSFQDLHQAYITSDLKYAVYSGYGGAKGVRLYEVSSGKLLWSFNTPRPCPVSDCYGSDYGADVHYLPGAEEVAVATYQSTQIRRAETGEILAELTPEQWRAEKGKYLPPPPEPLNPAITGIPVHRSPDGRVIVTVPADEPVSLTFWKAGSGERLDSVDAGPGHRIFAWFSPDENYLITRGSLDHYDPSTPGDLTASLNPYGNLGDVDLNGSVDVSDAVRSLRYLVELDSPASDERFRADVNGDDALTVGDVILTLSRAVQSSG
jgi:WD40 repeat protein